MRFIHTADWHLGRTFHNVLLVEEQEHAMATSWSRACSCSSTSETLWKVRPRCQSAVWMKRIRHPSLSSL
ncbi:MAG: hypothetical protein R6T96_00140, partial [Longimicrobiales bacterium]